MPKVVVAMPAYGAARTLRRTVEALPSNIADELIVVDDASTDETASIARRLGLRVVVHRQNRGYGGNQKTCYQTALEDGADIVVLLHPDFQYDPQAVPLLIGPILAGDADMTFGSRFAGLSDPLAGGMPVYRFVGNRLTTWAENLMLGSRFTEMHSGMRAYTRRCLLSLPFQGYSNDFDFDSQMLVDAVTNGLRVVEVPIPTRYTEESSSIDVGASLQYVAKSVGYAARRVVERGRRGRRSPPAIGDWERGRYLGEGPLVQVPCVLCGHERHRLIYPSTATGDDIPVEEFSCTTDALGIHDDIVQCAACSLVRAIPPIGRDRIVDAYREVVDESYLVEEEGRRELFQWILSEAERHFVPGDRMLEIGSNIGLFLDEAKRAGWDARGVEPSRWAVREGRERFGVDLREGTIEDLDEPSGGTDAIVMLDVLEHLSDPLAALETIRPVVKETGLLVLSTVDLGSLHARIRGENWPWFIRSHLFYFTAETLHHLLERSGWRMTGWKVVPRSFTLSYIAQRGGENLGLLGELLGKVSEVTDPRVPVGCLGDIAMVTARPIRYAER